MSAIDETGDFRDLFVGLEAPVRMLDGSERIYNNLDNAASTPALQAVNTAVEQFLHYYSSVHRGTGFKSQLSTHLFEAARRRILAFFKADPTTHTCIFGKNTTEALNKLARRFPFSSTRDLVITTGMEHHSNDLPWRASARVVHIPLLPDGRLDIAAFDDALAEHRDRVAIVAVTGASNVTGFLNPIHELADKSHQVGAQIAVDAAQLAPHRAIDMRPVDDPEHLDYVAISGHKMYAPFGVGALIGRRDTFARGQPDYSGGGTVEVVTLEGVDWAGPPERDEAGSPNTVGVVALAAAIQQLETIGMETVARHEAGLTRYGLSRLSQIRTLRVFGDTDPERADERLGVIPFNLTNRSHFLVASILGYEYGIGVRSGCFCAHPYVLHLLDVQPAEAERVRSQILRNDRAEMPGLVRASFGLYNTVQEIDALANALEDIQRDKFNGRYIQDRESGEYEPVGWQPDFDSYLQL